ncbi:MAG: T9SS type A sorting domain-containing protein [Bacteroidia bacterium]
MKKAYNKHLQVFFIVSLLIQSVYGQTYFEKTYQSSPFDQEAQDVLPTSDGGYLLAGYTTNLTINDCDVYIIKTDAAGNIAWTQTYGGNKPDFPYHMLATNDGNYFLVGYSQSYGGGDYDILLLKIDPSGGLIWTKTYGANGNDIGMDVIPTSDGNYMIVGSSNSPALADQNANLIKIDPSGTVIWSKLYGGSSNDYGACVKQTNDGGFIMLGTTYSYNAPGGDAYLVKLNSDGDTTWTKRFGGAYYDEGVYITTGNDGGLTFVVRDSSTAGKDVDIRVIKTDASGNVIWNKTYGGNQKDTPKMIQPTMDGGYIIGAISRSFGWIAPDMWILKLDASGDTTWTRNYGGSQNEHCYVARELQDGSYIACGKTASAGPDFDPIFVKLNQNGTLTVSAPQMAFRSSFKLYPNPSSDGSIRIESGNRELNDIEVTNYLGEKIAISLKQESSVTTVALKDQKPGIYFIKAESQQEIITAKFIIN